MTQTVLSISQGFWTLLDLLDHRGQRETWGYLVFKALQDSKATEESQGL